MTLSTFHNLKYNLMDPTRKEITALRSTKGSTIETNISFSGEQRGRASDELSASILFYHLYFFSSFWIFLLTQVLWHSLILCLSVCLSVCLFQCFFRHSCHICVWRSSSTTTTLRRYMIWYYYMNWIHNWPQGWREHILLLPYAGWRRGEKEIGVCKPTPSV